jgi:hypothetical protein
MNRISKYEPKLWLSGPNYGTTTALTANPQGFIYTALMLEIAEETEDTRRL